MVSYDYNTWIGWYLNSTGIETMFVINIDYNDTLIYKTTIQNNNVLSMNYIWYNDLMYNWNNNYFVKMNITNTPILTTFTTNILTILNLKIGE